VVEAVELTTSALSVLEFRLRDAEIDVIRCGYIGAAKEAAEWGHRPENG
jgi:hypothetical protein